MDNQSHIQQLIKSHEGLIEVLQKDLQKLKEMDPSTPEPKEPETWEKVQKLSNAKFGSAFLRLEINTADQDTQITNFAKRLLIADYCGRRSFIKDEENWHAYKDMDEKEWVIGPATSFMDAEANYFPAREQAEKYLRICQNSGLL